MNKKRLVNDFMKTLNDYVSVKIRIDKEMSIFDDQSATNLRLLGATLERHEIELSRILCVLVGGK